MLKGVFLHSFSGLIVLNYQFKITRLNSHNKKVYTQNGFVFHLLYLLPHNCSYSLNLDKY